MFSAPHFESLVSPPTFKVAPPALSNASIIKTRLQRTKLGRLTSVKKPDSLGRNFGCNNKNMFQFLITCMRWILKHLNSTRLSWTLTFFSLFLLLFFFTRLRRPYRRLTQWKQYYLCEIFQGKQSS